MRAPTSTPSRLPPRSPTNFGWRQRKPSTGRPRPRKRSTTQRAPFYRWFPDGGSTPAYNALDRHVAAAAATQTALIYDSPVTGDRRTYTYARTAGRGGEVRRRAGASASARATGWSIYMPMIPEAVDRDAGLRAARRGPLGRLRRLRRRRSSPPASRTPAKVIVAASCGIEPTRVVEYKPIIDEALEDLVAPARAHRRSSSAARREAELTDRDLDWTGRLTAKRRPRRACVPVAATDPLYILYTSGTTGKPKGVVRDNGGHAVALAWSMRNVYDIGRATCGGPRPTSAGSSATRTSSTRRSWPARPRSCTRASRSGRRTRARSGGSSPSTA